MTSRRTYLLVLCLILSFAVLWTAVSCAGIDADQSPPSSSETPRIAVVLPIRNNPDDAMAADVMIGINRLAQEFEGTIYGRSETVDFDDEVEFHVFVTGDTESDGPEGLAKALRNIADEGFHLIIGAGFHFAEPIALVHRQYPDTFFVAVDAYYDYSDAANALCLQYDVSDAAFLAGAVASDRFRGRALGMIGGMDLDFIRDQFLDPFARGVEYMDGRHGTRTSLITEYAGDFGSPERGYELAEVLFSKGVVCIYQAAGNTGFGVLDAARDTGNFAIGVDTDQGLEAALRGEPYAHILTSTVKKWGNGVHLVVSEYLKTGRLPQGVQTVGLAEDCVEFAINPYNAPILGDQLALVNQLRSVVLSGDTPVEAEPVWTAVAALPENERITMTVNDPILSPEIPDHYGSILQEALSTEFLNTGAYRVIDREQVDRLLSEINFSLDGVTEESRRLEVGRLVAAEAIVFVNLGDLGDRINVDCKLVDVETGLMTAATRHSYADISKAVDDAGRLVAELSR